MSCTHPRPQGKSQGWYSRKRNRRKLPVTYFRGQSLTNFESKTDENYHTSVMTTLDARTELLATIN